MSIKSKSKKGSKAWRAKVSAAQKRSWAKRKQSVTAKDWRESMERGEAKPQPAYAHEQVSEPFGLTNELVKAEVADEAVTYYKQWLDEASSPAERQHRKKLMYGLMYGGAYGGGAVGLTTGRFSAEAGCQQSNIPKEAAQTNPKTLMGDQKVPVLSVVPPASIIAQATAMRYGAYLAPRIDGKRGYGPYNWRDQPIEAHIYIDAAMRHLMQWFDGDEVEIIRDDQGRAIDEVSHLAFALATIGILLDAKANSTLIDDRPKVRQMAASNLLAAHKLARYEK